MRWGRPWGASKPDPGTPWAILGNAGRPWALPEGPKDPQRIPRSSWEATRAPALHQSITRVHPFRSEQLDVEVRGSPERRIFSCVREGEGVRHQEFPSRFFVFSSVRPHPPRGPKSAIFSAGSQAAGRRRALTSGARRAAPLKEFYRDSKGILKGF